MAAVSALLCLGVALPTSALEIGSFTVASSDKKLREALEQASLTVAAADNPETTPRAALAAAGADYARLVRTLYAMGYYSGVVNIKLDGREAASIPTFNVPAQISQATITVNPGPLFSLGQARIAPLAPGDTPPDDFRTGAPARSTVLQETVDSGVAGWRNAGHAKVALSQQSVTANHAQNTLAVRLGLAPGPRVTFGRLVQTNDSAVRADRIARIAGFPEGAVFSPAELETVAKRLRRTGAFSSVSLTEAETLRNGNVLDVPLALVDAKPRRFGFGAEISSTEGLTLSSYWMHRNLLGGAERLRVDGEISGIGGQSGGVDYSLGARLNSPAFFGTDTDGFVYGSISDETEENYDLQQARFGVGASRIYSDHFQAEVALELRYEVTNDDFYGERSFLFLNAPLSATWDHRDDILNPTGGYYLKAEAMPFVRLDETDVGARFFADGRIFRAVGQEKRLVFAGRVQVGSTVGADLADLPPDFLFFSGGGGTVRGQPYQSLGVDLGGTDLSGGKSFVGLSGEVRASITDTIGLVGFVDAGFISADGLFADAGDWHAGAGLGLRYNTGIGPIRLDVAAPVGGDTGDGVQFYVGIGQSF
ncbi:autotransporter assembly complex family protein [Pseudosulfitobacter sp. DSM 107133]|uniref:autotransporter assembly complex protein TamA n=1 Tax=Pseudosulfitobacter sp. DSM 107133 TaxID=2883100 RepID=UPI000DF2BAF5|nr:autotransporter assembly complex family protein [Pseudosulfitobacter sp. DSM 107133]UOA28632.1 Translocation and assembly module subunit TamA [Pseudosulfitobacter sp. DSM 107133]